MTNKHRLALAAPDMLRALEALLDGGRIQVLAAVEADTAEESRMVSEAFALAIDAVAKATKETR